MNYPQQVKKKLTYSKIALFKHLCYLIHFFLLFLLTSQVYRHKARKHKLRRCRFKAAISAMFNYSAVFLSSKEKRGKEAGKASFSFMIYNGFSGKTPGTRRHRFDQKRW
jgi:hypothetical protein